MVYVFHLYVVDFLIIDKILNCLWCSPLHSTEAYAEQTFLVF